MKHILVTGSNGLIGQQVVKELLKRNYKVTGISAESNSKIEHINFTYIPMDLTNYFDLKEVFEKNNFSHLIHLAAIAHSIKGVKISWSRYFRINTLMSRHIFELATKAKIPIFFSSTVDIYGIQEDEINEKTWLNPIGFYAKSKELAERILMETVNQPYLIARFAPVYTDSNKRDIYKRYYIKHPKLAYLINKGEDYEFLSSKSVVTVITQWVEKYDLISGVLNITDEQPHNTKEMLEKDISNGAKPIVIKIPKFMTNLMILIVNIIFSKLEFYKFSAYKILKPMKFNKDEMRNNFTFKD